MQRSLVDFFRARPVMSRHGIAVTHALRSVGVAVVAAVTVAVSGCTQPEVEDSLGYERPIPQPAELVPFVQGVAPANGRYGRWDETGETPLALYLRGAVGGDGYEVNWIVNGLDAPLPIPPGLEFDGVPPGTALTEDEYGVRSPVDPAVTDKFAVERIVVTRESLPSPPDTICAEVALLNDDDDVVGTQTFVIDPTRSAGNRVEFVYPGRGCPGTGPDSTFDVPIRVLG